jgi:adenosine deaminase CECR1
MPSNHSARLEFDNLRWEIEQGIPQRTDPLIRRYFIQRAQLIRHEKHERSDYAFRRTLTPLQRQACNIVSRICAEEKRTQWMDEHDDLLDLKFPGGKMNEHDNLLSLPPRGEHYHPGMAFRLGRERIKTTTSWQILRKMPKGALLHSHFDAMIDVEWLIDQALATEGMAILADQSMFSPKAREKGSFRFQYSKQCLSNATSIWNESYSGKQLVPLQLMANTFPYGGLVGFRAWFKRRCTITLEESIDPKITSKAIWAKFVSCFPILDSILGYEPIFRASVQRVLRELMEDNIRWVDLRIAFVFEYRRENCEEPEIGYHEFFRAFAEEVQKFQATSEGHNFWGSRFIWTTIRSLGRREIIESMKQCISMKITYPELIAGFDVVGHEDMGRTLKDLIPECFWFKERCMENGIVIPFFFHAGECLGDGDDTDHNLYDAILLGTRRVGHGFSLYKHPKLVEMIKQKKVLVEVCPISNEVLRLTPSIKAHPAPALLSRGVDVALCNDDTAILGHSMNGLTDDFWQALQGWDNLGLEGLGALAGNSVRYAAFSPDQTTNQWIKDIEDGFYGQGVRASRLREWKSDWNKYCEWIVEEYAANYGGDAAKTAAEEEEEETATEEEEETTTEEGEEEN